LQNYHDNPVILSTIFPRFTLDTTPSRPYSLPFRAKVSEANKSNVQLVLSVWRRCPITKDRSFDNYCGVNGRRRGCSQPFQRLLARKETSLP